MKKILPVTNAIVAIISGVFVLLGYFFPRVFGDLQSLLIGWAIILAAFALLLGIFNLAMVHWKKMGSEGPGSIYSIVLLISLVITMIFAGISGPTGGLTLWVFNTFQVPVEISLLAVLAIILVYAVAAFTLPPAQMEHHFVRGDCTACFIRVSPTFHYR